MKITFTSHPSYLPERRVQLPLASVNGAGPPGSELVSHEPDSSSLLFFFSLSLLHVSLKAVWSRPAPTPAP